MEITAQLEVRELRISDLSGILLSEQEHLTDPNICLRSSREDIAKSLHSGLSFGAFLNNTPIAYNLCYGNEYCIGFVEKCFVHPSYRGRGLQSTLLMMNMAAMMNRGIIAAYALTSPDNPWSLRNFKARGFEVVGKTEIEGHKRLILKNGN